MPTNVKSTRLTDSIDLVTYTDEDTGQPSAAPCLFLRTPAGNITAHYNRSTLELSGDLLLPRALSLGQLTLTGHLINIYDGRGLPEWVHAWILKRSSGSLVATETPDPSATGRARAVQDAVTTIRAALDAALPYLEALRHAVDLAADRQRLAQIDQQLRELRAEYEAVLARLELHTNAAHRHAHKPSAA